MPSESDDWMERARTALDGYSETLRRNVAGSILKPRNPIPIEELTERILTTLANPPVVDRRIADHSAPGRAALAILGQSRQPVWKVGHLLTMLAALGSTEGFAPIQALLDAGLLFPAREVVDPPLNGFQQWFGQETLLQAEVFTLPGVAARAKEEPLGLPNLATAQGPPKSDVPRLADGLEWPLRIAAVGQLVADGAMRTTQSRALFKRDLQRLQTHELLAAAPADHLEVVPDIGVLTLFWALGTGKLAIVDGELILPKAVLSTTRPLSEELVGLLAGLSTLEVWDPLLGYRVLEGQLSAVPSAGLLLVLLLASAKSGEWCESGPLAAWLWEHHPAWQNGLDADAQQQRGTPWVESFLLGVFYPLGIVEVVERERRFLRLSPFGRSLFAGGAKVPEAPAFLQTLMVQPNAEIIAYRQGLTPTLIGRLSRFARWKSLGPACTLELTAEQTYRGLETNLTLAGMIQTLNQHGVRPVPAAVVDLLQRWANKRERITVYSSATLVEFLSPADLDVAISRGMIAVRITDRIGLCADGADPDYKNLRLIGNRDYEAKPTRCIAVDDDGVTLNLDAGQTDLLLEAEIGRLADPLPADGNSARRYALTPESLRRAGQGGWKLDELDVWFQARTGAALPSAGRLFLLGPTAPSSLATKRLVLQVPNAEIADGLMQWPTTKACIEDRLGPTALAVDESQLAALRQILDALGVKVEFA